MAKNDDKTTLLREKTPMLNYTKRYDQVSWRSADTDFEVDPSASSADEQFRPKITKQTGFCSRRNRKLFALGIVVIVFLAIMAGLIYLYYSKTELPKYNPTPAVLTDCGKVTGIIQAVSSKINSYVFKGIPYARPPVGKLRWKAPIPLSENKSYCWQGEFKADKYGSPCVQGTTIGKSNMTGSEDCLYLNVYSPSLNSDASLPVLVWIHGGYLMVGNGNELPFSEGEFATDMNVVVVSLNYRLNAFGFLTLEELWQKDQSYGNNGFMDQILVLKWIQKNIQSFGGNPKSVTICGQSSGGTSVFGLLASPMADGLFHKAISMSGSPKFEKSYKDASVENRVFFNSTNCDLSSSFLKRKECLYNMTTDEVFAAIPWNIYPRWSMSDLLDFPSKDLFDGALAVIEPIVIPKPPKSLKDLELSQKVPVLVGSTAQEIGAGPNNYFGNKTLASYKNFLKARLDPFSVTYLKKVLDSYANFTNVKNVSELFRVEYLHETISSDVRVNCPVNKLTKDLQQSSTRKVFRYVIENSPSQEFYLFGSKYPIMFAFHMWDAIALFDFKMLNKLVYTTTVTEENFKRNLQATFKHFMLFGHPKNSDWYQGKTAVFNKNGDIDVLDEDYHSNQCNLWNTDVFLPYAWIN